MARAVRSELEGAELSAKAGDSLNAIVAAVEAAGIPWTGFKYSENSGQFQVIREQAGTFADSIRLWSE